MPSKPSLSLLASTLDTTLSAMLTASGFGDEGISSVAQADPTEHAGTVLLRTMRRLLTMEAESPKDALDKVADMMIGGNERGQSRRLYSRIGVG